MTKLLVVVAMAAAWMAWGTRAGAQTTQQTDGQHVIQSRTWIYCERIFVRRAHVNYEQNNFVVREMVPKTAASETKTAAPTTLSNPK